MADEERAVRIVVLAKLFDAADASLIASFPESVQDLFAAVTADPRWTAARTLADRALVVAAVLAADPTLDERLDADAEAGRLGLGAGDDAELDAAVDAVTAAGADRAREEHPRPKGDRRPLSPNGQQPQQQQVQEEQIPTQHHQQQPDVVPPQDHVDVSPIVPPVDQTADGSLVDGPAEPLPDAGAFENASGGGAEGDGGADTPASDAVPAADVTTWLNAEVQGGPASLAVGTPAILVVFFDDAPTEPPSTSVETVLHFLPQVSAIDLDIQLVSNDVTVPAHPQTLTVDRTGVSAGRALFEITPLHDGPSALSVVVTIAGNFLQRLDLTFDVGTGTTTAEAYGRPLGVSTVLKAREAVLEFTPMAGGYRLHAPQVHPDRFIDVLITPDELAARIEGVRTTLLTWVKKGSVSLQLDLAPADRDGLLRDLAQAGIRLYQSIFKGPDASDELKEVGAWLRESLSGEVTTLQVVSTGFPVPWPLMYLADRLDPDHLSWDDFIGMRHVVEQVRMVKQDAAPPPAEIASTPQLGVRVLYNDSIDDTMPSKPVAGQRAYWEKRGVALTEGTTVDDLVKGALAASASDQLLYLYCHAESSGTDPDASQLILTGNAAVTLGDLWALSPSDDQLAGRPLVFLNACESGEMSPNFYDGFVAYFTAKGARGVIGTECKTPGLFAGEWAKAFFDELFAGKTLGETVLDLRRSFLADHANPLGLLYGVHADPDIVVSPALAPTP